MFLNAQDQLTLCLLVLQYGCVENTNKTWEKISHGTL